MTSSSLHYVGAGPKPLVFWSVECLRPEVFAVRYVELSRTKNQKAKSRCRLCQDLVLSISHWETYLAQILRETWSMSPIKQSSSREGWLLRKNRSIDRVSKTVFSAILTGCHSLSNFGTFRNVFENECDTRWSRLERTMCRKFHLLNPFTMGVLQFGQPGGACSQSQNSMGKKWIVDVLTYKLLSGLQQKKKNEMQISKQRAWTRTGHRAHGSWTTWRCSRRSSRRGTRPACWCRWRIGTGRRSTWPARVPRNYSPGTDRESFALVRTLRQPRGLDRQPQLPLYMNDQQNNSIRHFIPVQWYNSSYIYTICVYCVVPLCWVTLAPPP